MTLLLTHCALVWLLAALLAAGCASSPRTLVHVPVDRGDPAAVTAQSSDEAVLRSVATVLVTRLGLPLTTPVRAYLYASQAEFERGLVAQAHVNPSLARDQATFATGVGTAHGIFLRGDKLGSMPLAARVGVLAHELTHVSQYELAGGRRGVSEQWLREGFAEYVKFRTVESLGLRSYVQSRTAMVTAVRQALRSTPFPDLDTLDANRDWVEMRRQAGSLATYGQAFLATDRLIDRVGHRTVVEYFRHAGASRNRDAAFEAVFGVSRAAYLSEFRRYLATLGP